LFFWQNLIHTKDKEEKVVKFWAVVRVKSKQY
jgi:hypothetical protein